MFLPIRTDRRLQHKPWVNYALIAANVAVFAFTQSLDAQALEPYLLQPMQPRTWHGLPYQFITSVFLHADMWHVFGNMLFLYVFGNSVEDRLGKVGYLAFYLGAGVIAGIGHTLMDQHPALGASGAVCAVTGAYLALFPLSNVTIVYWFIFIGAFEISSMYLIIFQIAQDLFFQLQGAGRVAYAAHLAGYAYGFAIGMALLATRLLEREPYDLLSMIEQRRRRAQFAALTRQGYRPWEHGGTPGQAGAGTAVAADKPLPEASRQIMELRAAVADAITQHDMPRAAELYARLVEIDGKQVMSQQQQLDLANQLTADGRYELAARAYELFLNAYARYAQREQVELILGLLYARYLNRRQRALELLTSALPRLTDVEQLALARQTIGEVKG
ncbi:MAG: rhomboid family intramembrane serine protease [Phycisphaeraceae bacterium]